MTGSAEAAEAAEAAEGVELPIDDRRVAGAAAAGPRLLPWFASAFVFAAFCVANALVWEPAHDEGVTWTQAFGTADLARCEALTSLQSLAATLDGRHHHSPGNVLAALERDGMHPPAYYLLVNGWASWVGTGRVALSVPAIALGVLSLLAMGRLAPRLAPGRASDAWAMFLLACSPWFVGYSVFARPYGLVLFASLWSTLALVEMQLAGRAGRGRLLWRVIFVAASCLGLYSLYHYAFVLAWQGTALLALAWQRGESRRTEFAALGVMAAAVVCAYLPWFASLAHHLGTASASPYYFSGWLPIGDWPQSLGHLLLVFALGEGLWSTTAGELRAAAAAMALCTLPLALRSLSSSSLRGHCPAARILWIASPVLPLSLLASDWIRDSHTLFISKTSFIFLPLLILLALRGWQTLPNRRLAKVGLSACVVLCAAATVSAIQTRGRFLTSFEVVAEYLRRTDSVSHRVVLSSERRGYTIPFLLTLREADVQNVQITLASSQGLAACLDSLLANPASERVTLVDFRVPYERGGTWQPEALGSAARRARSLGWHEIALPADDQSLGVRARSDGFWQRRFTQLPGDPRVLVIASPTKTKYFSE